jgi:alcohol dehydrogenase class IV
LANIFLSPAKIISGENALKNAVNEFTAMGRKALIVTDSVMEKLGNLNKVETVLKESGISYSTYAKVNSEPTDVIVLDGVEQFKKDKCDFLVALGGGSPIDTMKAIGMILSGGGTPVDYFNKVVTGKLPSMAAIPTTAGTGSEATQFTIITDTKSNVKMLLKGPSLMPNLAVIDPQFTMTAPRKVTSSTGLDALCHAVESFTSRKAQPLSDTFALSAVKKIFKYLPICFNEGNNVEARKQMSIAALEAGIAFNNSSVTIIHGMSRPIGALFHVPHGLSNAMLLKECLSFVLDGAYERFAVLGRAINAADEYDTDEEASKKFLSAVEKICTELEIPTLKEFGVDKSEFLKVIDKMSSDAMDSGSPQNTRKTVTLEDIKGIYKKLW